MTQKTYLQNRNGLTDMENTLAVASREEGEGWMEWEFGISKCKLLHTAWIRSTSMLYIIATRSYSIA